MAVSSSLGLSNGFSARTSYLRGADDGFHDELETLFLALPDLNTFSTEQRRSGSNNAGFVYLGACSLSDYVHLVR